mgnify:CR=1 FL=1
MTQITQESFACEDRRGQIFEKGLYLVTTGKPRTIHGGRQSKPSFLVLQCRQLCPAIAVGRLISVTDALNKVTTYAYDEVGNRISQTDANTPPRVTRFEYDELGRETKRILPRYGKTLDDRDLPVGVRWGVGGAIAQKFAKEGFFVVLTTRKAANAAGLDQAIREQGGASTIVEMDLVSDASIAKAFATETAVKVSSDALQVLGAQGYMMDHPLERHYRDVLCSRIHTPQDDATLLAAGRRSLAAAAPSSPDTPLDLRSPR